MESSNRSTRTQPQKAQQAGAAPAGGREAEGRNRKLLQLLAFAYKHLRTKGGATTARSATKPATKDTEKNRLQESVAEQARKLEEASRQEAARRAEEVRKRKEAEEKSRREAAEKRLQEAALATLQSFAKAVIWRRSAQCRELDNQMEEPEHSMQKSVGWHLSRRSI